MSVQIRKEQEFTTIRDKDGIPTAKTAQYLVHGATSEEEAFSLLKSTAPGFLGNLKIHGYEIDEVKGGGAFTYDVNYVKMSDAEYGEMNGITQTPKLSFDTSGGSTTMKQALKDKRTPEDAPDMKGGINWDGDQFNGVDIAVANIVETYSITIPSSKLTTAYKRKLSELTGTINNAPFKGWDHSEVLFMGASASGSEDGYIDIDFKFGISPIKRDFEFAGHKILSKGGWYYIWALYEDSCAENEPVLPKARAVYVCKTYEEKDFSELGIGT